MGGEIISGLYSVDIDEVWQVIISDLPLFKERVEQLLNILEDKDSS